MKTFTETDREKGRRLEECIRRKSLSQAAFVEKITKKGFYSLTAPNLSQMIHGKRTISRDFAHCAADVLKVSENYLMCETDDINAKDNSVITSHKKENDCCITNIVSILELNYINVFFYTLSRFINPQRIYLRDIITYKECTNISVINKTLARLKKAAKMPMDKIEVDNLVIEVEKLKQQGYGIKTLLNTSYMDYSIIRKKNTLGILEGVSLDNPQCFYNENNYFSEVVIECVEVNGQIMSYSDFVSLVKISSHNILSLFAHAADLNNNDLDFKKSFNNSVLG